MNFWLRPFRLVAVIAFMLGILEENQSIDRSIAEHAFALLPAQGAVLTQGGTGALSTGGHGTAVDAIVTPPVSATVKRCTRHSRSSRPDI